MELKYYLETYKPSVLNIGCGRICPPEHYGIDLEEFAGVDQVCDVTKGLPFKTTGDEGIFDIVITKDILEHIPAGEHGVRFLEEVYRVLKPGGKLYLEVPSTDGGGIGAFGHPYHISFWNKTKLKYFLDDKYTNGWRSSVGIKCWFEPEVLETVYNDYDMPYVRALLKKKD